jgi:hypothetical protein
LAHLRPVLWIAELAAHPVHGRLVIHITDAASCLTVNDVKATSALHAQSVARKTGIAAFVHGIRRMSIPALAQVGHTASLG